MAEGGPLVSFIHQNDICNIDCIISNLILLVWSVVSFLQDL